MRRLSSLARTTLTFSTVALPVLLAVAPPAWAAQRTFVHSPPLGNDANTVANCSLVAPCRSFNSAISVTDPGGELVILDTAGYGAMTITKSITVIGPSGVYGGISVLGASAPVTGITINAADTDIVKLRGLDIAAVPGPAPLPLHGIDIQNAAVVHIEKTSVSNFTQDASACINVNTGKTIRVYIEDSFLRECATGVHALGSAPLPNKPNVVIDNTRIGSGRNTSGGLNLFGVWMQGLIDVSLRNSTIARQAIGVLFEPLFSGGSDLSIINSELTRIDTGVRLDATQANSSARIAITGSQILIASVGIAAAVSGAGGTHTIAVADSHVAYSGTGVQLTNSGGSNSELHMDFVRSQNLNAGSIAFDLTATNGAATTVTLRDSTASNGGTLIKTSGSTPGGGGVLVGLVRSTLQLAGTAIDHGFGFIQLDGSRITMCDKDIVDSGGGATNVVSLNNNFIYMCNDPPGPTYITPTIIPTK